jgi:galactose mutarotase-like enzyme
MADDRELLELASDRVAVRVWPQKGCDIVALVDRASGIDLLWRAPWGWRDPTRQAFATSSAEHWIQRSVGGWNLLLPHAGASREEAGGQFGFHGEAGVVSWEVERAGPDAAVLTTTLQTAPLTVRRELRVVDDTLMIDELVTNDSPDAARCSWGHHPTFGAPLIDQHCRLEIPARTVRAEADAPVVGLLHDAAPMGGWPLLGGTDLSRVPAHDEPRALLAYLGELEDGYFRLVNERLGLGVEVRWPLELFPHVWLWQELHGSPGYPWFRRAYAMAVEPHSTVPAGGPPALELAGGASRRAQISARLLWPGA